MLDEIGWREFVRGAAWLVLLIINTGKGKEE